jgi:hypothetical protein
MSSTLETFKDKELPGCCSYVHCVQGRCWCPVHDGPRNAPVDQKPVTETVTETVPWIWVDCSPGCAREYGCHGCASIARADDDNDTDFDDFEVDYEDWYYGAGGPGH